MLRQISLNVVVLVLENHHGEILLSKRESHKHLGGMWEFPGGKVEKGESQIQALKREMLEEIDYRIKSISPLITTTHQYENEKITLDVWHSLDNNPRVIANENQPLKWVAKNQLFKIKLPDANTPIVDALLKIKC